MKLQRIVAGAILLAITSLFSTGCATRAQRGPSDAQLDWIIASPDGTHFVHENTGERFVAWGFNYDHDAPGRLIEDYWEDEWATVVEDFAEMKALGANAVRVHLQVAKFMRTPDEPDQASLGRLARLVRLAEETGLYLDITGLGCYHKQDVPAWYDALDESGRWAVQARFWEAVAGVCSSSPAIFCYDLMNEPVLPGADKVETDWLAEEFGGKHFVQFISLDLAGRTREEVARQWAETLVAAIRKHDRRHLITVGEIPWAFVFPGAKPLFAGETGASLDFVSVHFYPKSGEVDKALAALAVYDYGKPLVIEEMFPLACSVEELDAFIEGSRGVADGWFGFYWGKTIDEYADSGDDFAAAITRGWLEYFIKKTPRVLEAVNADETRH
jgi:hypothetical protein